MAEVRWTPQALEDLEAICILIARDAPQIAGVFAQKAFDAADRLRSSHDPAGPFRNWTTLIFERSFSGTIA